MAGNNDSDVLNVTINGNSRHLRRNDIIISNTETVRLADASSGSDFIKLTGAQLNLFTSIAFIGGGTHTINLTSTSTGLNALSDLETQPVWRLYRRLPQQLRSLSTSPTRPRVTVKR